MMDLDDELTNHSPRGEIRHGVRHLARDVVTLVELQSELLKVDLRNWLGASAAPAVILSAIAAIFALGSFPVLLLSLAYYLVEAAAMSLPLALLAAGGAGLLLAILFGLFAWAAARRGRNAFTRFRVELASNLAWLKQVLGHPVETAENLTPPAAII
jgi:hypothetical protein